MGNYTKSHSNYVLKNKHKNIDGGTIFERDWTTIGGIDSFAPNQIPVYRSGNFLITINNDNAPRKGSSNEKWNENSLSGIIWNYDIVKNVTSNTWSQTDKIILNNDYHSLRDYAYYGSCTELVRGSINGILQNFPGELYVSNNSGWDINGEDYSSYMYIENPFNIDIFTVYANEEKNINKLKYLSANDWSVNYNAISKNNEIYSCITTVVEQYDFKCDGNKTHKITFKSGDDTLIEIISVKLGEKKIYFTKNNPKNIEHIRPKSYFLDKFYDNLDSFESVILNPNTEPKYKATFEILKEGKRGFVKELKDFIFPVGNGDYNIGSNTSEFQTYLDNFISVTAFYDEYFSDNLYRMMVHEPIKNFDWTYNIPNENEEEYTEGKTKIDQIIRLFGREFDEIKFYIDGIKNYNKITYNSENNVPDYFLTDVLEIEGWDLKNITPIVKKENENTYFQDTFNKIKPYDKTRLSENNANGYYNVCDCGNGTLVESQNSDDCAKYFRRKKIKYSSEKEYIFKDINSLFLKNLKLNSRNILSHKGTIEGVEMMLGLFGLRSKRFSPNKYDFDVLEYTTFTNGIVDEYWECKGMTRIDWYNKTKTIQYNNTLFKQGVYENYQGLPISYRTKIKEDGTLDDRNIIYPYFNSNKEIDGKPYYQMDGGWILNDPIMFDKNNNIVTGNSLYTETLNSIKIVNTPKDLTDFSYSDLDSGQIVMVNNIDGEYLIIDGYLYNIEEDFNKNKYISISVVDNSLKVGQSIFNDEVYVYDPYGSPLGDNENILMKHYNLNVMETSKKIKLYLNSDNNIMVSNYTHLGDSFDFVYVNNGVFNKYVENDKKTNYFKIINKYNKQQFNNDFDGWVQLSVDDNEYRRINTIKNYYQGNNPHNGKTHYDGGFKYIDYFANLFNYSFNNEYFDIRPYQGDYEKELPLIGSIGFKNVIANENLKTYPMYHDTKIHYFGNYIDVEKETEHVYDIDDAETWFDYENDYSRIINSFKEFSDFDNFTKIGNCEYGLSGTSYVSTEKGEKVCFDAVIDGCTDQIINTKNVLLRFVIHSTKQDEEKLSDAYLSEIKYYQDIVMNYVSQMIPSTAILRVQYICSDDLSNIPDDLDNNKCNLDIKVSKNKICDLDVKIVG